MALQTAFALSRFGAKPYVGSVVGLALVRELGPVLAALMVGGRVGAGITAELGSMDVTEQVDAIRAMGADPVQKLVLPRVVAATLCLPLLTVLANVLGIARRHGDRRLRSSTSRRTSIMQHGDLQRGASRTSSRDSPRPSSSAGSSRWSAAHMGLATTGGTVGVGRATTRAVVVASIAMLIADFFLTKVLLLAMTRRRRPSRSSCAASQKALPRQCGAARRRPARSRAARPSRSWAARAAGSPSA